MKINQVEELVGITKKNIRFYEDEGLINPNRNPENGYREYNLNDVNELLKIKLLRMLSVPIEDIREMQTGMLNFDDCMDKQKRRLVEEEKNLELVRQLLDKLAGDIDSLDELDPNIYLSEMKHMEEGDKAFVDVVKKDVSKKKVAPVIISCLFILIIIATIVVVIVASMNDPIPVAFEIIICFILALPIAGVAYVLKQRIKEIDGGEEDDAKKY